MEAALVVWAPWHVFHILDMCRSSAWWGNCQATPPAQDVTCYFTHVSGMTQHLKVGWSNCNRAPNPIFYLLEANVCVGKVKEEKETPNQIICRGRLCRVSSIIIIVINKVICRHFTLELVCPSLYHNIINYIIIIITTIITIIIVIIIINGRKKSNKS